MHIFLKKGNDLMSISVKSFPFLRRHNIFLLAFRRDIHGRKVPSKYNGKLLQMFYKYFALRVGDILIT